MVPKRRKRAARGREETRVPTVEKLVAALLTGDTPPQPAASRVRDLATITPLTSGFDLADADDLVKRLGSVAPEGGLSAATGQRVVLRLLLSGSAGRSALVDLAIEAARFAIGADTSSGAETFFAGIVYATAVGAGERAIACGWLGSLLLCVATTGVVPYMLDFSVAEFLGVENRFHHFVEPAQRNAALVSVLALGIAALPDDFLLLRASDALAEGGEAGLDEHLVTLARDVARRGPGRATPNQLRLVLDRALEARRREDPCADDFRLTDNGRVRFAPTGHEVGLRSPRLRSLLVVLQCAVTSFPSEKALWEALRLEAPDAWHDDDRPSASKRTVGVEYVKLSQRLAALAGGDVLVTGAGTYGFRLRSRSS